MDTGRLSPLERLRRSGVTPDRSLGQNFLIDPNILDVIDKLAELSDSDTVLEVGPGAGVLTARLVERCGFVHCVEIDRRLASLLTAEFSRFHNFRLHEADALKLDLSALQPPPVKFVANLPYNVATPLIMKSLEEAASLEFWCLMVQKEIGDRLFARPGTSAYGAVSVMVQLATEKVAARQVPATVFFPRPRVRSTIVVFRRRQPSLENPGPLKRFVQSAFGQRRKTLVNSLGGAPAGLLPPQLGAVAAPGRKQLVSGVLSSMGLAPNIRPQQLTPGQYRRLFHMLKETAA